MTAASAGNAIRPTDAPLVRTALDVSPGLAAGWALWDVDIQRTGIRAIYRHARGAAAEVVLAPRGADLAEKLCTDRFSVRVRAHKDAPELPALVRAVVTRLRIVEPQLGDPSRATTHADEEAIHEEINFHLEWCPYLDLGVKFDHAACLAESLALRDRFVARHERNPGWRALAIKSPGGDPTCNVTYETADEPVSSFALTDVAASCPSVMRFLESMIDVSAARMILLLLLEPGGYIAPHFDDHRNAVLRSLNVAFNMPEGCVFRLGLDANGRVGPRTITAPFTDGSTMLLNVATCHEVRNDSREIRIHLYAKGEVRVPMDVLLARARAQNGIATREAIVRALLARRKEDGRPIDPNEPLARHARALSLIS